MAGGDGQREALHANQTTCSDIAKPASKGI
jgi:hypothetical protein